ncbi:MULTISPECIES: DUF4114 domain-containing protein [unclassified Coleofasciculus]|uniref:DUF4114 domain-containing protein n=1 Tax=unclassified Coleofasciculus TaxID=2692782 RepID=UPI00187E6D17|nr:MULTISPECIES: DUF4114 domain-containing protein [unclassified Coleofasciculus]MBE9129811.1 DUF4114 domain-containing protein [Coleofasciculus sp. LEGE 07081]MBE9152273.1 DUF4114 domain-containing protein [Coleofasciculus sp. LEGE 07092]
MPSKIVVTTNNNDGFGSLREAIALAQSGDTIQFDPSLTSKAITLRGQIEVPPGKNLIVDGINAPNLTISGNELSRIFYVNSNQDLPASLTLRNITLANGYTSERGGAIQITHKGVLKVENVEFKDNVADKGGGAIYSEWETRLTVTRSKFDGNKAIAGNDERGAGAIAFASPGSFTVKDSEFTNNQGINGAAINSLNGKLTIENSKFIDNDTTAGFYDTGKPNPFLRGFGGAVYTDRASSTGEPNGGTIQISNSVFEGNKGRGEGGAAYLYTAATDNVIIEGSLFQNNEILALPNGGNEGNGGAVVQLSNGLNQGLTVRNSTFANNTAAHQGGGLWTYDAPTEILNSTFSGNKTLGDTPSSVGGGMALYSPTDIENTTIAYNHAGWVGGGIAANNNASVTVKNTIFYENTADNGQNDWGIQQHTSRELTDLGGNVQYPPKATNNWNDYNATATITIIDPLLGPLQDNGDRVPTHDVGNPEVKYAGAFPVNSTGTANNAPTLVTAISDSTASEDKPFSLDISNNFDDSDAEDKLSFTATLIGGGELPSWLSFDSVTGTFSGTPADAAIGTLGITVTADDGRGGVISDTFDLTIEGNDRVNPTLTLNSQNDLLKIEGNPEQAKLQFTLTGGDSGLVNEIGVFVVDDAQGTINGIAPGEVGYLQAAIERGQVVFSNLPDYLAGNNLTRILEGFEGYTLGFFLVQDSSRDNVLAELEAGRTPTNVFFGLTSANTNSSDYLQVSDLGDGSFSFDWRDQIGTNTVNFNSLKMTVKLTDDSPVLGTQLQAQRELIDLRARVGMVQADFKSIKSEAGFKNSIGLYLIENEEGAVKDPITGELINPSDTGYAQAALAQQAVTDLNRNTGNFLTALEGGVILAPYIIANGTTEDFLTRNPDNQNLGYREPIAYFGYLGANPDGVDHIRVLGDNTFGFEDLYGGGDMDFNDMVFRVEFTGAA